MKLATIAAMLCVALVFGLTTSTASAGHYGHHVYYGYDDDDEYDYSFPICGCCHLYCGFGYRSPGDADWHDDTDDTDDGDDDHFDRNGSYDEGRDEDDREEDDGDDDYFGS